MSPPVLHEFRIRLHCFCDEGRRFEVRLIPSQERNLCGCLIYHSDDFLQQSPLKDFAIEDFVAVGYLGMLLLIFYVARLVDNPILESDV